MAITGARELSTELKAIRDGKPKRVYLVFGTEPYLVRNGAQSIADALAQSSGATVERVDAEGKPPAFVLEPVTALSLFSSSSVAIVRNFTHLLTGDTADVLLAGIDAGLADGSALVFMATGQGPSDKVDKRVKGYKGLAKRGAALELNTQRLEHLAQWLRDKAAEEGKRLAPDAVDLLLHRVGHDMQVLRMELDKAVLYCKDADRIDAADLEHLVGKSKEDAIWDVSEAITRGDSVRAMEIVKQLVTLGTYPLVVLSLLVRQTRHLLQARLLWEEAGSPAFRDMGSFQSRVASRYENGAFGRGADDVTTIQPFATFKRFEAARGTTTSELRHSLARLARADRETKTGAGEGANELLSELVLDLCAASRASRARSVA
jgi:DNA polymerase-3 subunit delta